MKVYVIGEEKEYQKMWKKMGHEISNYENADIVQFTGGEDVSPFLYGEENHPYTMNNPARDKIESRIFEQNLIQRKKMVGICRGGQFLNVMNGGSLWQHVTNHAIRGLHPVEDLETGALHSVTSTHHQMMIPCGSGKTLAVTYGLAKYKENNVDKVVGTPLSEDVEVVWYSLTHCLCFQPHPELRGADSTLKLFTEYVDKYLQD